MGMEKFVLESVEQTLENIRLSEELLRPLWQRAAQFEDFLYKSPWKDVVEKIAKNGNKITIGQAGAKTIKNKMGELLVYRKFAGYGPELPDGSPTLRFRIERPSGHTTLYVKPNLNGTYSPVKL